MLFAGPVAAGAGVVGIGLAFRRLDEPSFGTLAVALLERPALALVALTALVLVGTAWTIGIAAVLYRDAGAVEESGSTGWGPNGPAYAALVLVLPVAALHYLHCRYRNVEPAPGAGWWWLGFPLATFVLVLPTVVAWQGIVPPVAVLVGQGVVLAGFPVVAYRDAAYVRALDSGWRPGPALHFLLAVLGALLVLPLPIYAGYYLLRRRTAT